MTHPDPYGLDLPPDDIPPLDLVPTIPAMPCPVSGTPGLMELRTCRK